MARHEKLGAMLLVGVFLLFLSQSLTVTSALNMPPRKRDHSGATLPLVLASWERVDKMKDKMEIEPLSGTGNKNEVYDFIVVGAGTAGAIVASRLSEHFTVLLLEAGGQPHPNYENSATSMIMTRHPETDWMYTSVEQNETCVFCPDRKYVLSAGKGLGGSGNLNFLDNMYEGSFEDYSEWAEITKDPSWGFLNLQPHFHKIQEYMKKRSLSSNDENPRHRSTFKALVKPSYKLKIRKYAQVNKILLDTTNHARGVEYERHGKIKKAHAAKEVIIAAGTFSSPKLLMMSGIGPRDVLQHYLEIPTKMELPAVGKNFQDHLAIPLGPFFMTQKKPAINVSNIDAEWNSTKVFRMPLVNLNYAVHSKDMSHFLGIREEILMHYMESSFKTKPFGAGPTIFMNVALKNPKSRGEVALAGSDSKLYPLIRPNYLSSATDKQQMIEGLEETVRLMESNGNAPAKFTGRAFPGCESFIFRGYRYWDCYIRHFSMSFNHGVGTCAMGDPQRSQLTVVDPELKVIGVQGLRVIDASVVPKLVSTYPFQSVAVIAEKGAEMILKQHKTVTPSSDIVLEAQEAVVQSEAQPFAGFRIKKLADPPPPPASQNRGNTFQTTKLWQKADQIYFGAKHPDSSLTDDELIPPGEAPTKEPNPSYFSVDPLVNKLIFHPSIPIDKRVQQGSS